MTVGDACTRSVVTAGVAESLVVAARRMRDRHVGALVVVADDTRQPIGMLTDRDIVVSAVAQSGDRLESLLVGDVMTDDPVTALPTESLADALVRMREHGVRRLPVVTRDGELEGVLAADDIVEAVAGALTTLAGLAGSEQKRERETRWPV